MMMTFYYRQRQDVSSRKLIVFCLISSDQFHSQVWTKYGGQPAYKKEAKLYLPGKTLEKIEEHEDWYQELIYLQDRKREVES